MRELNGEGLDPKQDIRDQHVSSVEVTKLFGSIWPLKSTHPNLREEDKKGLHTLFWKVNGHGHIPKNEYMSWFFKGWIVQKKDFK